MPYVIAPWARDQKQFKSLQQKTIHSKKNVSYFWRGTRNFGVDVSAVGQRDSRWRIHPTYRLLYVRIKIVWWSNGTLLSNSSIWILLYQLWCCSRTTTTLKIQSTQSLEWKEVVVTRFWRWKLQEGRQRIIISGNSFVESRFTVISFSCKLSDFNRNLP